MTLFGVFAVILLVWEGLGLLTGPDRWPPTITQTVRRLSGPWQAVASVALLLLPLLHLVEVIE